MSLLDNLKNPNIKKIYMAEISYFDTTSSSIKAIFVSDEYCMFKRTSPAQALITPEIRLDGIPTFKKEANLIDNEVILLGSYSLKVLNKDNLYTETFIKDFFIGQSVKLYITTELDFSSASSDGEWMLLCKGNIDSITTETDFTIKVKDLNFYTQDLTKVLHLFNTTEFPNLAEDKIGTQIPTLVGAIPEYTPININHSDDETSWDTGLICADFRYFTAGQCYILTMANAADADRLRKMLKPGDLVLVEGNTAGEKLSEAALKYKGTEINATITGLLDTEIILEKNDFQPQVLPSVLRRVLIKAESLETNNRFIVSDIKYSPFNFVDITGYDLNPVSGKPWIAVGNNLSLAETIGDFALDTKITVMYKSNLQTCYKEDIIIESYSAFQGKIYFKNKNVGFMHYLEEVKVAKPLEYQNFHVGFEKIKSIKVNDKEFRAWQNYSQHTIGHVDNLKTLADQAVASVSFVFTDGLGANLTYTYISKRAFNADGNIDSIEFINLGASGIAPYTPNIITSTNSNGGVHNTVYYTYDTTGTPVGTTVDQINALWPSNASFSTTAAAGTQLFGTLLSGPSSKYATGGVSTSSFLVLNWAKDLHVLSSANPNNKLYDYLNPDTALVTLIEFQVGATAYSDSLIRSLKASLPAAQKKLIVVQNTWTQDQIGVEVVKQMNAWMVSGITTDVANYGVVASYDSTTKELRLQKLYRCNMTTVAETWRSMKFVQTPYFATTTLVDGLSKNYRYYFYDFSNTSNFSLIIDKLGLSTGFLGAAGAIKTSAGTETSPARKKLFYTEQIGAAERDLEEGDTIMIQNNFQEAVSATTHVREIFSIGDVMKITNESSYSGWPSPSTRKYYFNYRNIPYNSENVLLFLANGLTYTAHKALEIDSITIIQNDIVTRHVSDCIKELMTIYSITAYSQTDLDAIKTAHPYFYTYFTITDNNSMYKVLNILLASFNLYTFIDNDGIIRFKYFDLVDKSNPRVIDFNECIDFSCKVTQFSEDSIVFKENTTDVENKVTNSFVDYLQTLTGVYLNKSKQIETNWWKDIFTMKPAYKKDFTTKNFINQVEVELTLDTEYIDVQIGDNISIKGNEDFDAANFYVYKVFKVEISTTNVKITAFKLEDYPL